MSRRSRCWRYLGDAPGTNGVIEGTTASGPEQSAERGIENFEHNSVVIFGNVESQCESASTCTQSLTGTTTTSQAAQQ